MKTSPIVPAMLAAIAVLASACSPEGRSNRAFSDGSAGDDTSNTWSPLDGQDAGPAVGFREDGGDGTRDAQQPIVDAGDVGASSPDANPGNVGEPDAAESNVDGGPWQGECSDGQTQICTTTQGLSGHQTCGVSGTWEACVADPECNLGETARCTTANQLSGTKTCTADGTWGSCVADPECNLGETARCTTASQLSGTKTCTADGTWGSCVANPECNLGETSACTTADDQLSGTKTCTADGTWGSCVAAGGPYRGQLLGFVVVGQSTVSCSGPNGESVYSPMRCAGYTPTCDNDYRRVRLGSIPGYAMYACERTTGTSPIDSYQPGDVAGFAVVVADSNGAFTSCSGPNGGALYSPISCAADDLPRCAAGFRRVRTGSATGATPGSLEHSFVCERTAPGSATTAGLSAHLKGLVVATITGSEFKACAGANGQPWYPPMSCDALHRPQCDTGYRRVLLGQTEYDGFVERTYGCERLP